MLIGKIRTRTGVIKMSEDLNLMRDNAVKDVIRDLEGRGIELTDEAKRYVLVGVEETMTASVGDSQSLADTADYIMENLLDKKLIKEE